MSSAEPVIGPPDDYSHDPLPTVAPAEPAMGIGAWMALGSLVVSVLLDIGLPLSDTQQRWMYLLVIFLGPILCSVVIRSKVFSPATVDEIVQTLQSKLRGADLESSDAIAREQALAMLYPAVHALLTMGQSTPSAAPSVSQTAPQPVPVVYPLLSSQGPQEPAERPRFDPDYYTEKTTAMRTAPSFRPYTPGRHTQS